MCSFFSPVGEPADPAVSAGAGTGDSFLAALLEADGSRDGGGDAHGEDRGCAMDAALACTEPSIPRTRRVIAVLAARPADGAAGNQAGTVTTLGVRSGHVAEHMQRLALASSSTVATRRSGGVGGIGDTVRAAVTAATVGAGADLDR